MKPIRRRNVVLFVALITLGTVLAIWGPVWKHEAEERAHERAEKLAAARALDAAELAPCSDSQRQVARERYPESADEDADFSMFVMGGFGNAWRVSVTGRQVTVVEHWYQRTNGPLSAPIGGEKRLEGHAQLTPAHAKALATLMRGRITTASDEPRGGFDGAWFVFESGPACASTWMPHEGTGAERLVHIAHILANEASQPDRARQAQVEQELVPYLRSFEDRSDGDAIPLPRSKYLYGRGPEWSEAALEATRDR